MKKFNHNRVFNMVVALLLAFSLMCGNVLQVRADNLVFEEYRASMVGRETQSTPRYINGYFNSGTATLYYEDTLQIAVEPLPGGYTYFGRNTFDVEFSVGCSLMSFATLTAQITDVSIVIPGYGSSPLDYYGTTTDTKYYNANGTPSNFEIPLFITCETGFPQFYNPIGRDIYIEIDMLYKVVVDNSSSLLFTHVITTNYLFDGWNVIDFYRVPGDHTSGQLDTIIDQNKETHTILYSIKDRVGAFADSVQSWFSTLYTKIEDNFSALFQRMDEEQDELINGYQDTTTSEAANAFSSESDKLTALEGELSTQSNTYVSDYADQGFDLGILSTIGSSLVFVTTWFTNFWNMGGIFTAGLNFCFALSIVFFILRFKR